MRNGTGFSQRSILIGLCLIFIVMVFLINAIPAEIYNGERDEPSVSFQNADNFITTSSAPTLTSTTYQTPTIIQQTQVPPSSSDSVCATIWGIEPPTTLPEWLRTPPNADGLYTEVNYVVIAGHLISKGLVNASDCPDGGLTSDGIANTCGMEKAYTQVVNWQNQFNQDILTAAQDNQIPATVLKRLFAQETQFWPPNSFAPPAYGIGNVTSPGIEPLFMWYDDIYQNTCREVFSQSCTQPYSELSLKDQQVLRGFFISRYIHAYCDTCLNGIDLDKTRRSIDYFAKLIVANCHQVDLLLNTHGFSTQTLSYEVAWRLTLANYTVGAGCVINGVEHMDVSKGFSWEYFNEKLGSNCSADIYLSTITR